MHCAQYLGLWHTTAIKETVYWFLFTGTVLTGGALTTANFDRAYVWTLAKRALKFTIVTEFLVNLYVLPLAAELVLVPLIALFAGMQVVAETDAKLVSSKKPINVVLGLVSIGILAWVAVSAIKDLRGLLTREHGEALLTAPTFTVAFIPFLYVMWRWSRWDSERVMRE